MVWSKVVEFCGEVCVGIWIIGIVYCFMLKVLCDGGGVGYELLYEVFGDDVEDIVNGELGLGDDGGDLELWDWVVKGLCLLFED